MFLSRMSKNKKRKWVEALRSGNFTQTYGKLERKAPTGDKPVGYCCLGVLCNINGVNYTQYDVSLSPIVRQGLRMSTRDQDELVWMNDGCKLTFAQIADKIEATLND